MTGTFQRWWPAMLISRHATPLLALMAAGVSREGAEALAMRIEAGQVLGVGVTLNPNPTVDRPMWRVDDHGVDHVTCARLPNGEYGLWLAQRRHQVDTEEQAAKVAAHAAELTGMVWATLQVSVDHPAAGEWAVPVASPRPHGPVH